MSQASFRFNFFFGYLIDIGWLIFTLIFFKIFYLHLPLIAGWNYSEILVLLGFYWIYQSLLYGVAVIGNLRRLPKMIWSGELDIILLKPANSQFLVSIRHIWFSIFLNLIPASLFIYNGLSGLKQTPQLTNVACSLIAVFNGTLCIYGLWFMITCLAFFIDKAENLAYLPQATIDKVTEYPIDIFTGKLKLFFTWFIPIAFVASLPARILMGQLTKAYAFYSLILAVIILYLSHLFWQFSLKHYSSASS